MFCTHILLLIFEATKIRSGRTGFGVLFLIVNVVLL